MTPTIPYPALTRRLRAAIRTTTGSTGARWLPVVASLLMVLLLPISGSAATDGAFTDGRAAQLDAAQVAKLKALKAPIAVPTFVPDGYALKDVIVQGEKSGGFWIVEYSLEYRTEAGDSFVVNSANEGIGDAIIESKLEGENPYFEGVVSVGPPERDEPVAVEREVGTQWVESKAANVPRGARSKKQFYRLSGEGLSQEDALKVMLSLRYLK